MMTENFHLGRIDVPPEVYNSALEIGIACIDIETSGLDWSKDSMATCQVYIPNSQLWIIQIRDDIIANNISNILTDNKINKIFHHAIFDLRFFAKKWSIESSNVSCTKICSKILSPHQKNHSLKYLLQRYLHIYIDKSQRMSDWKKPLSKGQIEYASNDVLYLYDLYIVLLNHLKKMKRDNLALNAFKFIPTRVALDLIGSNDIFIY